LISLIQISEKS